MPGSFRLCPVGFFPPLVSKPAIRGKVMTEKRVSLVETEAVGCLRAKNKMLTVLNEILDLAFKNILRTDFTTLWH